MSFSGTDRNGGLVLISKMGLDVAHVEHVSLSMSNIKSKEILDYLRDKRISKDTTVHISISVTIGSRYIIRKSPR